MPSKSPGPVVRLSLAGDEILLLNKAEDAEELVSFPSMHRPTKILVTIYKLNRRSHNYSSRKALVYSGKYQSANKRILFLQYGQEFRKQRAAFHHMLQPKGALSASLHSRVRSGCMIIG